MSNMKKYLTKILSFILAAIMVLAFTPAFAAEDAAFRNNAEDYHSNIAPTEAEKSRARATFENYVTNVADFPVSMKIGEVNYVGFGSDFTLKNTEKTTSKNAENYTLTIKHKDGLEFTVYATLYPEYAAYKWTIYFKQTVNEMSDYITDIKALDIIIEGEDATIHSSYGDDGRWQPLIEKIDKEYSYYPLSGRSTDDYWPYYNITYGNKGMYMAVGWTGQWLTTFDVAGEGKSRITAGQKTFNAYVLPDETFRTPMIVILLYDGNDEDRAINLWRHWFIDCHMPKCGEDNDTLFEPLNALCMSGTFNEMTIATEDKIIEVMQKMLDDNLYFEWLWMDAGWYYGADGERTLSAWGWGDLGSWLIDEKRFPTKLKAVTDFAKANGFKGSLLWFEYTRTGDYESLRDDYSTIHKSFIISPGSTSVNLGNEEAVKWLIERLIKVLQEGGIDLFREDVNSNLYYVWTGGDGVTGRPGVYENKWIMGKYEIWDAIRAYTKLPIDTCASGGHILDIETLGYAVPLHQSDYSHSSTTARQAYHLEMAKWMPYFGSSSLALAGATDKYDARTSFAPFIVYFFNLNANVDYYILQETLAEKTGLKDFYYCDYYALTDWSLDDKDWAAWEYFDYENQSGYAEMFRREEGPETQTIKLKGLDPDNEYHVWFEDMNAYRKVSGKELMDNGITVTLPTTRSSDIMYIKSADQDYEQRALEVKVTEGGGMLYSGVLGPCIREESSSKVISLRLNMSLTGETSDGGYIRTLSDEQVAEYSKYITVNGVLLSDAIAKSKSAVAMKVDLVNNILLLYLNDQYFDVDKNNEVIVEISAGLKTYEGIGLKEDVAYMYVPFEDKWTLFESVVAGGLKIIGNFEARAESVIEFEAVGTDGTKEVVWKIADNDFAAIGKNGTVIAYGEGTTTVTVECDGETVVKKIEVSQAKRDMKFGISGLSKSPNGIFIGK